MKIKLTSYTAEPVSVADIKEHEIKPFSKLKQFASALADAERAAGAGGHVRIEIVE